MSTTSMEETETTAFAADAAPAGFAATPPLPADPAPAAVADALVADASLPAARAADPDVTTFRGRTLEELLPQIREQLGPDAIVVRQRDGLGGGIGGFFQQRFVEVDAKRGGPRIDVYDEEPAPTPESFAALLADAEVGGEADAIVTAATPDKRPDLTSQEEARSGHFEADALAAPAELPAASGPTPLDAQTPQALTLTHELTQAGMSHTFAERLVQDAEAHELPFTNGDLRQATRRALARRIPTSLPHRAGGLAVAFAGPGSTACADALATAYKRAGRDARAEATLDRAQARLERGNPDEILVLDLPPIAAERAEVDALAERLARLTLDEVVAVLPADLDLPTARALLDRLGPLSLTAVALTGDAQDACPAAVVELVCTTRLPIAYVQTHATAIAPADPATLAERLLP
jgi:Meckel syndrome type 1 protein